MLASNNSYIFIPILIYSVISYIIFNKIHEASNLVIDELFHIPQGQLYCNGNFSTWDPKITTLPGLYLVSAVLFGPLKLCFTYWLRFTNLIASVINLYLLILLVHKINQNSKQPAKISSETILTAVNIATLPPLYFFSHLYYTDTLSVTFVLLMFLCNLNQNHISAGISGFMAILLRQTNVIWVGLCFAQLCLRFLYTEINIMVKKLRYNNRNTKQGRTQRTEEMAMIQNYLQLVKSGHSFKMLQTLLSRTPWWSLIPYVTILVSFVIFVYVNGSIVVGDKSAHQAKLHLPQIFYFSVFYAVFSFPHILSSLKTTLVLLIKRPFTSIVLLLIVSAVIHFNTIVHPYLLADNRHYTFYIWNRFLSRTPVRYGISIFYLIALKSLYQNLNNNKFCYNTLLSFCTFAVIAFQSMIEVRYFLIPFVIMRLKFENTKFVLFAEFLINLIINIVTIYIFLTKEIFWQDFDDVQRLIW